MELSWHEKFRYQFNGLNRTVFLNSAAVCLVPDPVKRAVYEWARRGETLDFDHERILSSAQRHAARFVGGEADEIFFSKSTTHGIQQFIINFPWKAGDSVVLSEGEFPANRLPWLDLRKRGIDVRLVESVNGLVDLNALEAACDATTRVISVSWVQYHTGQKLDLQQIGEFCRTGDIFFVVDAIQGLGIVPLDARTCHIDWLSADGHKWLCAPEGIGIVWVSQRALDTLDTYCKGWTAVKKPFDFTATDQELADNASRFNDGSHNILGIMALDAALVMLLNAGIDRINQRVEELAGYVIEKVHNRGGELLTPENSADRAGIVSFTLPKTVAAELQAGLRKNGIVCSARSGALRFAVHAFNRINDINRAFAVLDKLAKYAP